MSSPGFYTSEQKQDLTGAALVVAKYNAPLEWPAITAPASGQAAKLFAKRTPGTCGYILECLTGVTSDCLVWERATSRTITPRPDLTDITNDLFVFEAPHGFKSGDAIVTNKTESGLTANTVYFVGAYMADHTTASAKTMCLFGTAAQALVGSGTTGIINITGPITGTFTWPGHENYFTPATTDLTNESVLFQNPHGYNAGDAIVVNATGGGLTANTIYYAGPYSDAAHSVLSTTYLCFYDTKAHAIAGGATGLVNITAALYCGVFYVHPITIGTDVHRGVKLGSSASPWESSADENVDVYIADPSGAASFVGFELF